MKYREIADAIRKMPQMPFPDLMVAVQDEIKRSQGPPFRPFWPQDRGFVEIIDLIASRAAYACYHGADHPRDDECYVCGTSVCEKHSQTKEFYGVRWSVCLRCLASESGDSLAHYYGLMEQAAKDLKEGDP